MMKASLGTALVMILLVCPVSSFPTKKDRPFLDVQVNDHPLRLTIDTGAEMQILFSYAADRIGLAYQKLPTPPDPNRLKPGQTIFYSSELCRCRFQGSETMMRLPVFEIPPGLRLTGYDGVVGWANLSKNILHIDWGQKTLKPVPQVPDPAQHWQRFDLFTPPDPRVLALQVSESGDPPQAVYIDTGDPGGVLVTSALWQEILAQHPGLPRAVEGTYSPAVGYSASPVCWLRVLKLGNLELHDVPVSETPRVFQQWPGYFARIGLYALTRLELVVDGKQNRAYVRATRDYPKKYDYNRAGAVFLPPDSQSADLLATVLDGSPAYEAGIRNGDRLLRVEGKDITGWRTDPNGWLNDDPAFERPAGTKVALTVEREAHPMEVTVVLRELLPIEGDSGESGRRRFSVDPGVASGN